MVWYQKFEYAVGHWLQKTAEHVFGSVLCSPGCFSLFRGSALMDDNVLKRYTTTATRASEYVQYDQGWWTPALNCLAVRPHTKYSRRVCAFVSQGRIVGCVRCYCSRDGEWSTTLRQTRTPTRRRSSRSFTTRGDDGDPRLWPIRWTFCTGQRELDTRWLTDNSCAYQHALTPVVVMQRGGDGEEKLLHFQALHFLPNVHGWLLHPGTSLRDSHDSR